MNHNSPETGIADTLIHRSLAVGKGLETPITDTNNTFCLSLLLFLTGFNMRHSIFLPLSLIAAPLVAALTYTSYPCWTCLTSAANISSFPGVSSLEYFYLGNPSYFDTDTSAIEGNVQACYYLFRNIQSGTTREATCRYNISTGELAAR